MRAWRPNTSHFSSISSDLSLFSRAEIILDNAREKFTEAGLTDIKSKYVIGDPADSILEYAEQNKADLIVLGHRGLGPNKGLLGGAARKLVNMTPVSCLIVTHGTEN